MLSINHSRPYISDIFDFFSLPGTICNTALSQPPLFYIFRPPARPPPILLPPHFPTALQSEAVLASGQRALGRVLTKPEYVKEYMANGGVQVCVRV